MIGWTISHYKILEELGAGGMGVVYRAEDTKLKRTVALKFLPPELTRDKDAKTRFIHEARATSALQHNNICAIHEIDETSDGRLFIVMDCYDGETLKERIAGGPLPFDEAIDIAGQIAEGLSEAHEVGMAHRDIKPANIVVTDKGVVKILDFGLAKLAGMTKVTKTGTTVGTVAYMSPEQASGEEVGHQTDIWSLGVVLYEMLTGTLPFKGDHEAAVMYGIMQKEPDPLVGHRSGLPEGVQSVIDGVLKKDPAERYETATELRMDLDHLRPDGSSHRPGLPAKRTRLREFLVPAGVAVVVVILGFVVYDRFFKQDKVATPSDKKMIAVLPFENLGSAEDEYFADGVTDEIIARLAGIHSLGVIARTSVMQYKNTQKTIQQIGEELGVEYVLEGTVRWQHSREGPARVRVTPQLIHVADATHLWADTYDETIAEIFQVQSRIAQEVSRQLNIALGYAEARVVQAEPTEDFEAYTHYLRGREHRLQSFALPEWTQAEKWYASAVERDSAFAMAWAELALVQDGLWWEAYRNDDERASDAKRAAETALRLDPELPEAHIAMGVYYYHQLLDYERSLEYLESALEKRPSEPEVLFWIGAIKRRQGQWPVAVENFKKAHELDPHSGNRATELGGTYRLLREYDEAIRYYDRAISIDVSYFTIRALVEVLRDGNIASARTLTAEVWQRFDKGAIQEALSYSKSAQVLVTIELVDGDFDAALDLITNFYPDAYDGHWDMYPKTQVLGDVYQLMGQTDRALAYYDSARTFLETRAVEDPEDARVFGSLGYVYARLGRKDEAVKMGERAVALIPTSKDAVLGPWRVLELARIHMVVGEHDLAVDGLEYVLSVPCWMSAAYLRIDPRWDPLRGHPRFQALLAKYSDGDS